MAGRVRWTSTRVEPTSVSLGEWGGVAAGRDGGAMWRGPLLPPPPVHLARTVAREAV